MQMVYETEAATARGRAAARNRKLAATAARGESGARRGFVHRRPLPMTAVGGVENHTDRLNKAAQAAMLQPGAATWHVDTEVHTWATSDLF